MQKPNEDMFVPGTHADTKRRIYDQRLHQRASSRPSRGFAFRSFFESPFLRNFGTNIGFHEPSSYPDSDEILRSIAYFNHYFVILYTYFSTVFNNFVSLNFNHHPKHLIFLIIFLTKKISLLL